MGENDTSAQDTIRKLLAVTDKAFQEAMDRVNRKQRRERTTIVVSYEQHIEQEKREGNK